jgi:tetrahydromethanopterin S-methyltransferase subunit B
MKKILISFIILLSTISSFAVSEDTKLIIELVKSETKANRDLIIANQEAINKRFEAVDKRFEDMQKSVDKRFEDMNKRLDTVFYIMSALFTITMAGFGIVINYLIKERKSITKEVRADVSEYMEYKLTQKADAKAVDNIITIIEKLGTKNKDIAEVLKKHQIRV